MATPLVETLIFQTVQTPFPFPSAITPVHLAGLITVAANSGPAPATAAISADNKAISADNKAISADNRAISADNKAISADNRAPSADNKAISADNRAPSADNK